MSTSITAWEDVANASSMTWDHYRILLETQRTKCVRQRRLALAVAESSMPDQVAMSRSGALSRMIDAIDAALARIADGTYGACVRCGMAIPAERLELLPFAPRCISCQEHAP